jgi:hypothetical protein
VSAVVDALWQQTEPHVFITREQFEQSLADWTVTPVERDGALYAAVVTRGPELHFTTFQCAPISLRMIREHVEPIIAEYGFLRTRTPKDELRQQRFNERMGFVRDGEDEFFLQYRLDAPAWRKLCR